MIRQFHILMRLMLCIVMSRLYIKTSHVHDGRDQPLQETGAHSVIVVARRRRPLLIGHTFDMIRVRHEMSFKRALESWHKSA